MQLSWYLENYSVQTTEFRWFFRSLRGCHLWLAEIFLDSVLGCSTSVAWFSTTSDVLVFCLPLERSIALQGLPFRNSHGHQGHFPTFICFYSFIREFSDHCFRDKISWFSSQDLYTGREILGTRRSLRVWEQASEEGGSWEKTWMQWRNLEEKEPAV